MCSLSGPLCLQPRVRPFLITTGLVVTLSGSFPYPFSLQEAKVSPATGVISLEHIEMGEPFSEFLQNLYLTLIRFFIL